QTISHYNILEKLGEGGMGVVYKAQDTKLDRLVALKFLPDHLSQTAKDLERFLQEAKAAAGLNHPNICTIHGIEEAEGEHPLTTAPSLGVKKHFIVMEFVDGQTLQEKKSSLSLKQALDIGIQIAEGLAAAHEKGIVHRDIKPENIMIRKDGIVQIMDFGLAKLRGASRLTKEGSTVGTAGYMSPEQVQGQETDHRSDIFSLGVLLYEMLSGQPPFKGVHETAIAYEIVNVDSPPMSVVKTDITPELDSVVLDCLEKDPKERTQAASQVALELKRYRRESSRLRVSRITAARPIPSRGSSTAIPGIGEPDASPATRGGSTKFFLIAAVIGLVAIVAGFGISQLFFVTSPQLPLIRTALESTDGLRFNSDVGGHSVISPDGTLLAFVGVDSAGRAMLYVRTLASKAITQLAGTQGANYPFWSPDNRSIGFFASGKLKRVDISGNPPLDVADAASGRGGAWGSEGFIVFSPDIGQKDLFKVPASGGTATPATNHDSTKAPRFPSFLPDGKHFLYVRMSLGAGGGATVRDDYEAYVGSLEGESKQLPLRGVSSLMFASGHVLYLRQETLVSDGFDPGTFTLSGNPVPIDNFINTWPARAKGDYSISQNGILVYGTNVQSANGQLVWVDREGRTTPITSKAFGVSASLSGDGKKIAFDELASDQSNQDVWIYDIERGVRTRFTFDTSFDQSPIWTPDGASLVFSSQREGRYAVYRKQVDGTKSEEKIVQKETNSIYVTDISPDGRFILLIDQTPTWDLAYADLEGDKKVIPILATGFNEGVGAFSPDGRWVAFQSDESGRNEIYVIPFQREGGKYQVSTAGGNGPIWGKTGELFFDSGNQQMLVRVDLSGASPRFTVPKPMFNIGGDTGLSVMDVTKDGKRFLASKMANASVRNSLSLIVNWPAMVGKK
ncbi:MAG: protein kinase, partial [Bacteroidota bacterium]